MLRASRASLRISLDSGRFLPHAMLTSACCAPSSRLEDGAHVNRESSMTVLGYAEGQSPFAAGLRVFLHCPSLIPRDSGQRRLKGSPG